MSSPIQEAEHNTLLAPDLETTDNNELSAVSSDSDSDTDKFVADTNQPTFFIKMLNFCKELTIMVLIAVAYAALTNENPPKVSKSPAAYPFFPENSLIKDWYKGQITLAIEEARNSDIAFVMFYAPWDAESQATRRELELTAKYMHDKVTFAAVNCWQPGSECKRQYSKVYKWPVLIAYPTHGRGIQYSGPLEAFHMIKFLQNICKPLERVTNVNDLMGKHNIVVSANINVLPGSYEYAVFYSTALRFLERDPLRDTIFAVTSQSHYFEPSIFLHIWNGTIRYTGEWSPDSLSTWILLNSYHLTGWVSPTGMKSLTLSTFMQPGPTLILFTPKNPFIQQNDYYNMLREVAYDYRNCANDSFITKRLNLIKQERKKNLENYNQLKIQCLPLQKPVITNLSNVWTNTSTSDICNCASISCPEIIKNPKIDVLTPSELQKFHSSEVCRNFLIAEKYSRPIFDTTRDSVNISGLACVTNTTLKFLALDSLRFYQFAERLGLDLTKNKDKSGVVVVNERVETHYIMTSDLNLFNLQMFIYNLTQKSLSRSLKSKIHVKMKSNHVYPYLNCSRASQFCVRELTSENFLSTILENNKVVLVFYYSKQCSFCSGIGYIFLNVAKLLRGLDDIVLARIDGDSNLLPWEYTMETYPTILFLPSNGKSESRTFPRNIPVTVPNLIGFIYTNVEPILKLKTMWFLCCQTKFIDERISCLASLRMETLTIIGKTLKEWRNSTRKQNVLYKLQVLKHLHLLFAHTPDDLNQIKKYFNKLRG